MAIRRPNIPVSEKVEQATAQSIKDIEREFDHWFDNVYRSPTLSTPSISGLADYADDAAASAGGIAIGGTYRTGSLIKVRVA
jgi:N-acetyl-gamma-glutamylphosphate reductase